MTGTAAETSIDQRIFLHGLSWDDYETVLRVRNESSGVRISYLEGELELMSPSRDHEWINEMLGRLLSVWAEERGVDLNSYGSWTVKRSQAERGVEPDKCYVIGALADERPDIAIEVFWTHGGLDKLEIYRGLEVPEVWIWRSDELRVYALRAFGYEEIDRSELLPDLDLDHLVGFLNHTNQTQALREYRRSLRSSTP